MKQEAPDDSPAAVEKDGEVDGPIVVIPARSVPSVESAESKIKADDFREDLRIVQIAYGVMLILGMRSVAESSYAVLARIVAGNAQVIEAALELLLAFGAAWLGMRFFWATGNIRRLLSSRRRSEEARVRSQVIYFHFPVLMFHSFLFFAVGRTLTAACDGSPHEDKHFNVAIAAGAMWVVNIGWLLILMRGRTDRSPESIWLRINLCCTAVLIVANGVSRILPSVPGDVWYAVVALTLVANSWINVHCTSAYYLTRASDG
jgi:hypothetical protein